MTVDDDIVVRVVDNLRPRGIRVEGEVANGSDIEGSEVHLMNSMIEYMGRGRKE